MSRWIEKWTVYGDYAGDRKVYTVARDADDNFGCSCAAWKFQKGAKSDCKHISEKKEALLTGKLSEVSGEIMHYYTYGLICFLKELQGVKLPANKRRIKTILSLSEAPASRETLLSIGISFSLDKSRPEINMAATCGAGITVQGLVDNLINRLAFYQHAGNQYADFHYQQNSSSLFAKADRKNFNLFNFLTKLDGAYLATASLRPLLDRIKDLFIHLPSKNKKDFFKDKKHMFHIAWPEMLSSKLFNKDDMLLSTADLIKPDNITRITETFHSLLLKDYGQEYAALLMEDKTKAQDKPSGLDFYP